ILTSSLDGERIAREAAAAYGFRVAILRCGGFYSSDGWHTRVFGESLVRGRPVLVDGGAAVWSWIHADDAASAFVAASEWPKSGVWHVVDDRPVSLSEYVTALATRLGTRPPPPWRRSRFSDSIPRSPPPFSPWSWRLRSPTDSRPTFSSRGPTRWRSLAPMTRPCCSLRRRSGSASLSSPRSRSGYPSSAAPSEILRAIPRD